MKTLPGPPRSVVAKVDLDGIRVLQLSPESLTPPTVVGSVDGASLVVGHSAVPLLKRGAAVAEMKRILGTPQCTLDGTEDLTVTHNIERTSCNGAQIRFEPGGKLLAVTREW